MLLSVAVVRYWVRVFWDTAMFHLLIKNRGRIPASDSFVVKRIAGPGLASDYFYQVIQVHSMIISTFYIIDRIPDKAGASSGSVRGQAGARWVAGVSARNGAPDNAAATRLHAVHRGLFRPVRRQSGQVERPLQVLGKGGSRPGERPPRETGTSPQRSANRTHHRCSRQNKTHHLRTKGNYFISFGLPVHLKCLVDDGLEQMRISLFMKYSRTST